MSSVKRKIRRLENYRAKIKSKSVPEIQGRGRADAREATRVNLLTAQARKKVSGKAAREFDGLELAELRTRLDEARKELFNLRFKQATGQLQDVASLGATKKRVARILTLIKQKEVGA